MSSFQHVRHQARKPSKQINYLRSRRAPHEGDEEPVQEVFVNDEEERHVSSAEATAFPEINLSPKPISPHSSGRKLALSSRRHRKVREFVKQEEDEQEPAIMVSPRRTNTGNTGPISPRARRTNGLLSGNSPRRRQIKEPLSARSSTAETEVDASQRAIHTANLRPRPKILSDSRRRRTGGLTRRTPVKQEESDLEPEVVTEVAQPSPPKPPTRSRRNTQRGRITNTKAPTTQSGLRSPRKKPPQAAPAEEDKEGEVADQLSELNIDPMLSLMHSLDGKNRRNSKRRSLSQRGSMNPRGSMGGMGGGGETATQSRNGVQVLIVTAVNRLISVIPQSMQQHKVEGVQVHAISLPRAKFSNSLSNALEKADVIVGEAPFIAEHLHMCANVKWIQVTGTSTLPIELAMARAKAQAKALEHTLAEAQRRMEEELAAMDKEIKIIEAKMGNIAEDLADAKEAMSSISTRHLAELASLRRPPGAVKLCITATCVLLGMGHNLEWKNVKKLIGKGGFVPRCMNFDPYTMTEELVAEMEENFLSHPSFNIETMRKASMPTGIMTLWILSLVKVAKICIKNGIGESMRRRAEFEERLAAFNAENHGMNCDTLEVRALKEVGCPIDVILTSVRGVFGPLVSEYVLGRIIETERNFAMLRQQQHEHLYSRHDIRYRGLRNMCVGIMGASGDVGGCLAKMLSGFGTKVIGLGTKNRIQTSDVDKWFNSTAKGGVMGFLKQNLDFIVNCMPRHKSTRHLLDARKLLSNKAKSSNLPVLINVGNGDLIKEKDLEALLVGEQRTKGGGISHAILDAHEGDTLSPDSKLWDSPHVTISPRVAGMSGMCAYPISDMFSEALVLFLEHKHIPRSIFINNLDDFSVADPRAHRRSNTHRRSNSQMQ